VPGHPEVNDEPLVRPVERHHDVLAPAFDGLDRVPDQPFNELVGRRVTNHPKPRGRLTGKSDRLDRAPAELRAQVADHGFDFRKLGHAGA